MMSDKIKFYNRTGYGEWNEKVVGKPKKFCVICGDALDVLYRNSIAVWTDGHNAEPIAKGRCCNFCNDTKVIPARIKSIQQGGLTSGDKIYFENEHTVSSELIEMRNNIIDIQSKINKIKEEEDDG
tara:strand:+ start:60 stop:437 length:378 start_codon:yes stop_codon:yes gene_type:complete